MDTSNRFSEILHPTPPVITPCIKAETMTKEEWAAVIWHLVQQCKPYARHLQGMKPLAERLNFRKERGGLSEHRTELGVILKSSDLDLITRCIDLTHNYRNVEDRTTPRILGHRYEIPPLWEESTILFMEDGGLLHWFAQYRRQTLCEDGRHEVVVLHALTSQFRQLSSEAELAAVIDTKDVRYNFFRMLRWFLGEGIKARRIYLGHMEDLYREVERVEGRISLF